MNQYNIIWLRPFYVIFRCTCINSENGACTYMYYLFFPHTIARSRIHMWLFSFYELVALNKLSPIKILHIFYFSTKTICIMLYTFCQRAKSRYCAYELMWDNMGKKINLRISLLLAYYTCNVMYRTYFFNGQSGSCINRKEWWVRKMLL